ncbi:MAG: TlpA family protein disulfide reductase [Zoogloeaceae bacterium]|jgi:thiol-disulfide isomerase/thioredoxin|nr:TlpA family protein disulfide reductase [Zoogloeaceae bacterium]
MNARRFFILRTLALLICVPSAFAADGGILFTTPFTDLRGQPTSLQAWRGKPLIVNFWARACPPCREELPLLNRVSQRHARELTVIGIAVEDQAEAVRDFVAAYQLDYPMLIGRAAGIRLMADFGNHIAGLPFTLFIDATGRVVQKKMGALTEAEIAGALNVLLPRSAP